MKIEISQKFKKDMLRLEYVERERVIGFMEEFDSLDTASNIKKLKGFPNYYRIRLGDFRIGVKQEDDTLLFLRVLPRKDIYKRFP